MISSTTSSWCAALAAATLVSCGDGPATTPANGAGGAGGGEPESIVCKSQPNHKPIAIYGGDRTMLAVMDDGTVYCWRENGTGQCDLDEFGVLFDYPRRVPRLPCVVKAVAGNVGIAMTADGSAWTWGVESHGERGDGDGPSPVPTQPTQLTLGNVTDVSGNGRGAGVVSNGMAFWWGQLQEESEMPRPIGRDGVFMLAIDVSVSCLVADGNVECWGATSSEGLGGPDSAVDTPVPIALPGPVRALSMANDTGCVVLDVGEVWCWGDNFAGGLGRGEEEADRLPDDPDAAPIAAPGPFDGVVVADNTQCAWRPSGEVLCWGDNYVGMYAPLDGEPTALPRRVPELEPAKQVAVVYDEVCALGFDEVVRCRIPNPEPGAPGEARILDFINPPPRPQ